VTERGLIGGKFVTLIDVFVISLIAAFVAVFCYFKLSPEQLQQASNSLFVSLNFMLLLTVTGAMYFVVRRIK